MSESSTKINPLMATAAIAVIIFSAVGVGVMTGVIPSSKSSSDVSAQTDNKAAVSPVAVQPAPTPVPVPVVKAPPAPVHKHPAPVAQKRAPVPAPQQVAINERTYAPPPPPPVARICNECGVIDMIDVVEKKGEGTGMGAVGGAVIGGLLGKQIGKGRGNTAATVVGVVGGAVAGHEVEKRVKSVNEYRVAVRMEDGTNRYFTFDSTPSYVVGEKVKVIDGRLARS